MVSAAHGSQKKKTSVGNDLQQFGYKGEERDWRAAGESG